jgi:hypothetical protein
MDPDKPSDAHPYDESPPTLGGRPNISGLAALAGAILAVSLVFHAF